MLLPLLLSASAEGEPLCEALRPRGVFRVAAADLDHRLRVGARPGDLALRNSQVTAVVRRKDGSLVDFWRNEPTPPTTEQLQGEDYVDGLWTLSPQLRDARGPLNLAAQEVRAVEAGIEALARVSLGAGVVQVLTRYQLDGELPRLRIVSRLRHEGGGRLEGVGLGDLIKWGNTDYFVEGLGRTKSTYSGRARWVGRRGAGGDLRLATEQPMAIDFQLLEVGSAPAIYTRYGSFSLSPGLEPELTRVLEYAPLPPAPAASRGALLRVVVTDEDGQPLAAKLSFQGRQGTPEPQFGSDGGLGGASRFVWSGTGRFERSLAPGHYAVLATAGFEREAARFELRLDAGQTVERSLQLPRAFPTPGWVSADLHLHQVASVDADISDAARVVSVAAEGVELAVASDHYTAHDLAPAVARLVERGQLARPIITIVGSEVSTVGHLFGHFNLFPVSGPPAVEYEDTRPRPLFAAMRAAAPNALLQVNHPRFPDLGYFHRYRLDPTSGRVPAQYAEEYEPRFDLLEVFNGIDAISEPKVRLVLKDYMHLLGRGERYVATGNSDSHKLYFNDPGVPRNFIQWRAGATDAEDARATEADVIEALRAGRVMVSSGPFLDVSVDGVGPGGRIRGKRRLALRVRILAASWVDVTSAEVLLGPEGHRVRFLPVGKGRGPVRLDQTLPLDIDGPTFVLVVARGTEALPNVYRTGTRPFAFTNPIWLEP